MVEARRCMGLGLKTKSFIASRFHRYATRSPALDRQLLFPSAAQYRKGRISTLEQAYCSTGFRNWPGNLMYSGAFMDSPYSRRQPPVARRRDRRADGRHDWRRALIQDGGLRPPSVGRILPQLARADICFTAQLARWEMPPSPASPQRIGLLTL